MLLNGVYVSLNNIVVSSELAVKSGAYKARLLLNEKTVIKVTVGVHGFSFRDVIIFLILYHIFDKNTIVLIKNYFPEAIMLFSKESKNELNPNPSQ